MFDYSLYLNISLALFLITTVLLGASIIFNKKLLTSAGLICLSTGILSNTLSIFSRGIVCGHMPMSNTYETLVLLSWLIAIIYLFFWKMDKEKFLATGCSLLIVIIIAVASFVNDVPRPLVPALQSNWLTIHVLFCFISYAAFAISFVTSSIHLIFFNKKLSLDFGVITYKTILFGYAFLILGITTGSVWGEQAWGSYWSWDPKETWSLITFFIYTLYLHTKALPYWNDKKRSLLSLAGFSFIVFTYFGVNYLLAGLHSYG